MAKRQPPRPPVPPRPSKRDKEWLGSLRGSLKEARERLEADRQAREAAERNPKSVILDPATLAGRKWDAASVLHTTLGGVQRPITQDDLAAFRHNIKLLQGRLGRGGITARQVIDLSGKYLAPGKGTDRQRAAREIHHAIPSSFNKGALHVITDAGGQTPNVKRHHVLVQFPNWDVAVMDVNRTPDEAARWLLSQPLKYECDCGRHRFFFRYICTAGGFNAGRPEHGYPKIRNPNLTGVACKHVVRVMTEIDATDARFRSIIARAIKAARDKDVTLKRIQTAQAEAARQAGQSARTIRSSEAIDRRRTLARERAAARASSRSAPAPRQRGLLGRTREVAAAVASRFGITSDVATKILNFIRRRGG